MMLSPVRKFVREMKRDGLIYPDWVETNDKVEKAVEAFVVRAIAEAVAAEREACVEIVEQCKLSLDGLAGVEMVMTIILNDCSDRIAAVIRARTATDNHGMKPTAAARPSTTGPSC